MLEKDSALWAAAGAAVAALGGVLARWWERGDKRDEREAAERSRREASAYDRQDALLDGCYKRVRDLEADFARVEVDRDHGWDKARALYGMLHDARHKHVNTIQAAVSGRAAPEDLVAREPPEIPPFAAIVPKEPH